MYVRTMKLYNYTGHITEKDKARERVTKWLNLRTENVLIVDSDDSQQVHPPTETLWLGPRGLTSHTYFRELTGACEWVKVVSGGWFKFPPLLPRFP